MSDTNVTVVVNTRDEQPQVTLFGVCFVVILVVMFIVHFWQYIVATIAIAALAALAVWLRRRSIERQQQLALNADQEMAWLAAGDPRGVYGSGWSGDEATP